MKWFLIIFYNTIGYFIISFVILSSFLGAYSLFVSRIKLGVFKLYLDFSEIFYLSVKIGVGVFFSVLLHVLLIQIPNSKKSKKNSKVNKK